MKILLASSEVAPFAKTGGLADVAAALPIGLAHQGTDVSVIMPAYSCVRDSGQPLERLPVDFELPIGTKMVQGGLLKSRLPDSDVPVYLVEQDFYFDRAELYREQDQDYKDNCERFVFFCRAVLETIRKLPLPVELVHCNDWQTCLIPAYLKIEHAETPELREVASLLTIHNMAYQGQFWHWDMILTGLDWKYFNWRQMEFHGYLNLLKTGIVFADTINTVSRRYAQEIQSDPLGCGLEGALRQRRDALTGITNGVDYGIWDPAKDPHLVKTYDVTNWREGKEACKAALQQRMGLPVSLNTPLIGMIGRLADQKGWDLVDPVLEQWAREGAAQWVILGTGDERYHKRLRQIASEYPNKVAMALEFSDSLAHQIEAGADIFLMPSRYEPCGLNQLYSLKYGTLPLVRATGGLADTIVDMENGFSFERYDRQQLHETLLRACDVYLHDPTTWQRLVETGMKQDWSWDSSARQYVQLYEQTIERKRAGGLSL